MTEGIKIISKKEYLKNNKKPTQEEVWDNINELWVAYKRKPFFCVEDFLKDKKGKVIDLGCGSGRNMIASSDLQYYGVDFSEEQIKSAEKITSGEKINSRFFKSSADKLDKNIFKNEMFDYGLFIATLHCIEGEKERVDALKEFYRVLKFGAEGLISVWNSFDERFDAVNHHGDIYMSWKKDGIEHMRFYYLFSKDEFLKLVRNTGFKIIEIYEHDGINERFSEKNWIVKVKK